MPSGDRLPTPRQRAEASAAMAQSFTSADAANPGRARTLVPGMDVRASACIEVGGDAHVAPLLVGFDPRDVVLRGKVNGVAAEQQPQRRLIQARDVDDDGRCLGGVPGLGAVMTAEGDGQRADGGIVLWP